MSNPMPNHLFVSDSDGSLYDTRDTNWSRNAPLRKVYSSHYRNIASVAEFKACLRAGSYSDLGGYPLFFITSDSAAISFEGALQNLTSIFDSIANGYRDGYRIVALDCNWEDSSLYCDITGKQIPSAYGNDDESDNEESSL
jgi:hypothetical protein